MAQTLQRNLGPVSHLTAKQYTVETATGDPVVCCPKCGGLSDLELGVHVGGVVAEEWKCPCVGCPFKAFLHLESWGEEVAR